MSVLRCVFLGTPDFAQSCLDGLIQDSHFQVVGVVSQPDRPAGRKMQLQASPVKQLAESHGIEVITPENVNAAKVLEKIAAWRAEVAIVVAFGQIVSQKFLDLFPQKVINVHASLLPRWRGAAPIQRSIMEGDKETGICLQVMVRQLDAGAVLGSRRIQIDPEWTAVDLHERLKPLARELLAVELMDYLRGNLVAKPQDEKLVSYAHKIDKSEAAIDWNWPAQKILNRQRGLTLGPGVHTRRKTALLKIHSMQVVDCPKGVTPGTVVALDGESFTIACGQGAIRITSVQPESRARMSVKEYLRGYPIAVGERLES